jgi:hypothetical protein
MERMAQRKAGCSFDGTMTVKWRKFAQKLAKLLRRAETFSDQDLESSLHQHLDAF